MSLIECFIGVANVDLVLFWATIFFLVLASQLCCGPLYMLWLCACAQYWRAVLQVVVSGTQMILIGPSTNPLPSGCEQEMNNFV
jgi:hypothetical protein